MYGINCIFFPASIIMINQNKIIVNKNKGVKISQGHAREGWGKPLYLNSDGSPAKQAMRAGKKKRRSGGNEFLPARQPCETGLGVESVSAIPASAGRQNRKIFVSLIEKNFAWGRLKNVKKIFLFCSSVLLGGSGTDAGRKRWAGQLAKSSGFCSKKVLTSSSRHHQSLLAASLGASPLASAGRFARRLKGFLKSIESFCWLIWRFANLESLLVLKKTKADFFFRL